MEILSIKSDSQTYAIIGAAMAVHSELGFGFLEAVYHEALAFEFKQRNIAHRHEVDIPIAYKGQLLQKAYRADFVCFGNIIVELKAIVKITKHDKAQVLNYVKATGYNRTLLSNFGASSLEYERFNNQFK